MTNINNADFSLPSQLAQGFPITGTGSFIQIHSVPTNFLDEIYVWVNNPTTSSLTAQVRFGSGGPIMRVRIPPLTTYCVLNGVRMRNSANSSVWVQADGGIIYANINSLQRP